MSDSRPSANPNVRSAGYSVVRTLGACWHCGLSTQLVAIALPPHHETLNVDELESSAWELASGNAVLFYVEHLCDDVQSHMGQFSAFFRLARSEKTQSSYWANHCEHCATLLDDHDLHCEPGGAFVPVDETAAGKIQIFDFGRPFEAAATGYSLEPEFIRFSSVT